MYTNKSGDDPMKASQFWEFSHSGQLRFRNFQ